MNRGNLKPLVNDPTLYAAFQDFLNEELVQAQNTLISASEPVQVYRAQGRASMITRLLKLKEIINGGERA